MSSVFFTHLGIGTLEKTLVCATGIDDSNDGINGMYFKMAISPLIIDVET